MVKEFNDIELRQDLESNLKIYLYFFSTGCGPCKTTKPKIEEFGRNINDIVYLIPSQEAKELQQQLKVSGFPSIVVIENKQFTQGGIGEKEIIKIIDGESN